MTPDLPVASRSLPAHRTLLRLVVMGCLWAVAGCESGAEPNETRDVALDTEATEGDSVGATDIAVTSDAVDQADAPVDDDVAPTNDEATGTDATIGPEIATGPCAGMADGAACDDADPCTEAACEAGVCKVTKDTCSCESNADCPDDANLCNGTPYCDLASDKPMCKTNPASVVTCQVPDNSCVASVCSPSTGACMKQVKTKGTVCDDGKPCTVDDTCTAGTCAGKIKACDDGTPQSIDICDPADGTCKHLWPEVCDGKDNDDNGATDDVMCGSGKCTCSTDGVTICPSDCTACPDEGDIAILIDDAGASEVVCAHDYPAWGIVSETPATLNDNGDGTLTDARTGLMWQIDVSPNTYTWTEARELCDDLTLATKEDWRIPTIFELESIMDFSSLSLPTIASPFQASTPKSAIFWSATSFQSGTSDAWLASFGSKVQYKEVDPGSYYTSSTANLFVRCVRQAGLAAPATTSHGRYVVNTKSQAVFDRTTGLTWQREPPSTSFASWEAASQYCDNLSLDGKSDWRTPRVVELRSLIRRSTSAAPAVDIIVFPSILQKALQSNTASFWTDTPRQGTSTRWAVRFDDGATSFGTLGYDTAVSVLCVRSPPCGDNVCEESESALCALDCGCSIQLEGMLCEDGNPCTIGETCKAGACSADLCDDGYAQSSSTCDPLSGCSFVWPEVCDSQDNDGNGVTDDVLCGSGACTCDGSGVATCPSDCTACPDEEDLAVAIDDAGVKKVVCAHEYPAWGIVSESPSTLIDNGDGTVTDSKTGLMWQLSPSSIKHNLGSAKQYCDELTLATNQDWRLPTSAELESIVDYAQTTGPAIAPPFVGTTPSESFWSIALLQVSGWGWVVDFYTGESYPSNDPFNRVRCVRHAGLITSQAASNGRYMINFTAKTVLDKSTGLTWEREPPGTNGNSGQMLTWSAAKQYCADLSVGGYTDWRLPNIVELRSLVKRHPSNPEAIDSVAFPNAVLGGPELYWSASTLAGGGANKRWGVGFHDGWVFPWSTADEYHWVRCVRTPPCGDNACDEGEIKLCPTDCGGCSVESEGMKCDDGNACTVGDSCSSGSCEAGTATSCDDGYAQSIDSCDPVDGCTHVWIEVCDGQDNDNDGTTDDVQCGSGSCICGADSVAVCPADCDSCPDEGDLTMSIDDGGIKKVVCAHDYPAWGVVAEAPATLTKNGDGTVTDATTGLMWQMTPSTSALKWSDAWKYCDELELATNQDWRLPTLFELSSIVDFTKEWDSTESSGTMIAAPFMGDTPGSSFWSATSFQGGLESAWRIDFAMGRALSYNTSDALSVRCVRQSGLTTETHASNSRYSPSESGLTVLDKTTGLTWQRKPPGDIVEQIDFFYSYSSAEKYCAGLALDGKTDWRLPTIVELRTIVKHNASGEAPAIDSIAFPSTPVTFPPLYWSSTSAASAPFYARAANFFTGESTYAEISMPLRVRCVQ